MASTAAQVESVRKNLLKLPIGDGLETDVSLSAQQEIKSMKVVLGEFVDAEMHCVSAQTTPAQIERDLSAFVHAFHLPSGVLSNEQIPADFGKYGFELWFDVKTISEQRLVAISASFSIECGTDSMLFIFAPDGDSWKEVLRWQSQPYKTVAGAIQAFAYGISPARRVRSMVRGSSQHHAVVKFNLVIDSLCSTLGHR